MGLYVSWPDDKKMYSDGFVTVELIHAMPEAAVKANMETTTVSHTSLSKQVESAAREVNKAASKPVQKVAAMAVVSNTEVAKQIAAKPEEKAASDILTSTQAKMEMQQAQSQRKWERVRARLEESKWYPASARRRGIEGDVELGFALNREGYARYSTVLTGSGYAILDQAALETVKRAEPFPADGGEYRFKLRFRRL